MVPRRRFSVEYKREAVAMLESPGVSVSQIAAELGIRANILDRQLQQHVSVLGRRRARSRAG